MRFSVAFIFLAILLISCQPADKTVHFSADIQGLEREKATISGMGYEKELTVVDGKIQDTLQIPEEGLYNFRSGYNRTDLYLTPGNDVSFKANSNEFNNSLSTEGINAAIFAFLKDKSAASKRLLSRSNYDLDANTFLDKMNMAKDSFSTILNASELNSKLKSLFAKNNQYEIANQFLIYRTYFSDKPEELPAAFADALNGFNMHDEQEYLMSRPYRELVSMNFSANSNKDTVGTYEEVFMRHIAAVPAGNIKNNLLYGDMQYLMGPNENLDKFYNFFKEHSTNKKHLNKMKEQYTELQTLAKGKDSPTFNYDNYKGGKTKLEDLAGKYVYVDVWATWCGPCKAEIPHLKETEEKYHGKNIEFVSISIDEVKDNDKWKKMIEDKELGGTQLFADNAWQSQFVQDYKIKGIPRFILIDPAGKIVSADAPRPSEDKLIKTFEDLSI